MALTIEVAPTVEPVTRNEAKLHCRIDSTDEDTYVDGLIAAARRAIEIQTGRALVTQTLRLTRDIFPASRVLRLERPPLQSITSVKYQDTADVEQTLSAASYQADAKSTPGRLVLKDGYTWPSTKNNANSVTVIYVAGYGLEAAVPQDLKQAVLLLTAHLYANREPVDVRPGAGAIQIPKTIDYLCMPYKVWA